MFHLAVRAGLCFIQPMAQLMDSNSLRCNYLFVLDQVSGVPITCLKEKCWEKSGTALGIDNKPL